VLVYFILLCPCHSSLKRARVVVRVSINLINTCSPLSIKHEKTIFHSHCFSFFLFSFSSLFEKKGGDYISDGEQIVLPLLHPETNDKMKGAEIVLRVAAGIKADVLQVKGKPMQASTFIYFSF
jgi:hypothetical protein